MDIAKTLAYGWPTSEWTLNGDDYSGLVWLSQTDKPTMQQIETAYEAMIETPVVPDYPSSAIMKDLATGEAMKVVIKNGEVFIGGLDEEIA